MIGMVLPVVGATTQMIKHPTATIRQAMSDDWTAMAMIGMVLPILSWRGHTHDQTPHSTHQTSHFNDWTAMLMIGMILPMIEATMALIKQPTPIIRQAM